MSILKIDHIKKIYSNGFTALKDVSFSVNEGEIVALLGKNGAGKTTLLNCIAGNIFPTSGDILFGEDTLLKENSRINEFGVLIEPTFVPYMNAYDNLKMLLSLSDCQDDGKIEDILTQVGLEKKQRERTKAYSFGMRQRLGLAQALLNNPHFLMLDEPFVGLDPLGKKIFKKIIIQKAREEGVGILFSSHNLEDVEEICDRIVLIDHGEKKFDGVMQYDKTYILVCSEDIAKEIFEDITSVVVDKNIIKTKEVGVLNKIFVKLNQLGIALVDLELKQKSLYDFFEE